MRSSTEDWVIEQLLDSCQAAFDGRALTLSSVVAYPLIKYLLDNSEGRGRPPPGLWIVVRDAGACVRFLERFPQDRRLAVAKRGHGPLHHSAKRGSLVIKATLLGAMRIDLHRVETYDTC